MSDEENFDKKMSLKFLATLNRHLPAKKKKLKELLLEDKPAINNKDGSIHSFDRKELEKIASMVAIDEHERLRLPIYLEMSISMERGTIKISGRLECAIIRKILGIEREGTGISMTVYYPHLSKIRKELSTTTQYMFTTS